MSRAEQEAFARKYYAVIAESKVTGEAVELDAGMVDTAKACCDSWGVQMWFYWPTRIWIVRCQECNAQWAESALKEGAQP